MADTPYQKIMPEEMILRDHLAIERTVMANHRSFLACMRTTLSLVVAGGSFIKFSGYRWVEVIGWVVVVLGLTLAIVGIMRFLHMKRAIDAIRRGDQPS